MDELKAALANTEAALKSVRDLWAADLASRTNRMADIVSLLDRAKTKLEIELRHPRPNKGA